jgi:fucose permease
MSLNTVGNTLIPVVLFEGKDPARASNFGNAFFGLGYVLTPFLITLFLKKLNFSYSTSLSIFGILALLFLLFALTSNYPKIPIGFSFSKAISLLIKGPVLIAALALFCYISLEVTMGTWINTFMQELFSKTQNMTAEAIGFWSGMVLTLFGISMMLGRFITSTIKNLTAMGVKVIAAMAIVSLLAIILMIVTKTPALAAIAVILVGLAFAPIFPTIVGVTFAKFDPSLYGSIFGIIFAIGLLGGTFVPKFIGDLSKGSSIQQSLAIAAVMAAILFILALVMGFTGKAKK